MVEIKNNKNRITFQTIIGVPYIRHVVFNSFTLIQSKSYDDQYDENLKYAKKGRDIIKLPHLGMISQYGMPWDFIKHYLPEKDKVLFKRRLYIISKYCSHPNATLDTLNHLLEWSPDYDPQNREEKYCQELAEKVAGAGHRDIMELLITRYPEINPNGAVDAAAVNGHLSTLELINNASCNVYTMDVVAKNGHLDVIKFLHENRSEGCTLNAMNDAASNGHLDIIKFLHFNRTEGCSTHAMIFASYKGDYDIVEWLHFNRSEGCSTTAMDNAARNGHFKILKFLHDHRTEGCTTEAMDNSASLEITQFLHNNRSEGCTHKAMDNAAARGRLDMVEWLHYNRTEGCTYKAMQEAIKYGHFDIIKFLYQNRTEGLFSRAFDDIALYKTPEETLEILTFVNENLNVECTSFYLIYAIQANRLDIVQYLHQHYPTSKIWKEISPIDLAADNNLFEIVKWLHYNRNDENSSHYAMDSAAMSNNLEMLEFLHFNRSDKCECSTSAMDNAASYGNMQMLEFLYKNRTEGCTSLAMDWAAAGSHLDVVKYLHTTMNQQQCTLLALQIPHHRRYPDYDVVHYILSNKLIPLQLIQTNAQSVFCLCSENEKYYEIIDLINHYYDNILIHLI
ncbi:hypothetical protein DFA_04072 [Cavenderia fasciculata]|uniref:Ankyrin repeat-containing protein n=1 Tax=Cavenderia fasciculata TaxID=261658 RepID=F4Q177_CACFS|nr:uncharacterized protein DFA_04072 [Cavenderia fasciculata]EGG18578.1 hypothetical protein DFA_04072 [Cavenderia fasciculata]|eukprot:XP_004366482.1 hypothetical protein DFA_04072 [Cavenderia fasciculata]